MECTHHAGTAATAICTRCDNPLCSACVQERGGRNFCSGCAEFLDRRSAQGPRQTGSVPVRPVPRPAATPALAAPPPQATAGSVYQGPPPATSGQAPGPVAGDLYQGPSSTAPPPPDDVDQGDVDQGDIYQGDTSQGPAPEGDVYQGDVYQGSLPSGAPVVAGQAEEVEEGGSTGRAILFGSLVGLLSAVIWYGVVTFTHFQFGFLAIIIGWLVGAATTAGAGRGGSQVAFLSLAIATISMVGGDYLINDHFYRKFTSYEIQEEAAFRDGDISDEDIALYFETSVPELHAELTDQELEELRQSLEEEATYATTDDYDPQDQPEHLPLSELPGWMGWSEFFFIAIGAYQAFRVPLGGR